MLSTLQATVETVVGIVLFRNCGVTESYNPTGKCCQQQRYDKVILHVVTAAAQLRFLIGNRRTDRCTVVPLLRCSYYV